MKVFKKLGGAAVKEEEAVMSVDTLKRQCEKGLLNPTSFYGQVFTDARMCGPRGVACPPAAPPAPGPALARCPRAAGRVVPTCARRPQQPLIGI
jgi:hypothetical protein